MFYIEYQYGIWSSRCDYGGNNWWIKVSRGFRSREKMLSQLHLLQREHTSAFYREKGDFESLNTVEVEDSMIGKDGEEIVVYCDGSCHNVTGEGGIGVYMRYKEHEYIISQGYSSTTSNRMELRAFITALQSIQNKSMKVHIFSDSQYVVNTFKSWIFRWEQEKWVGRKNVDLLEVGLRELREFRFGMLNIHWCKGHSGIEGNEIADMLAEEGRLSDNKLKCQ